MIDYWKTKAHYLATKFGRPMAVVCLSPGHYQVWSLEKVGKDYEYSTEKKERRENKDETDTNMVEK